MKRKISKVVLSASLALSLSATAFAASFTDVSDNHWASKEIDRLAASGVIKGYPDGTFKPNNSVTRAEFATMVNLAFDLIDEEATVGFLDVHKTDWFYAQVATAKKEGLFSGYPDGTFKPNSPITREEAAVVVANLLNLDTSGYTSTNFADDASISDWAKPSIAAAVEAGVLAGYPDGTFGPKRQITRAETSVVVLKAEAVATDVEDVEDETKKPDEPATRPGSGGGGGRGGGGGGGGGGGVVAQTQLKTVVTIEDLYGDQLVKLDFNRKPSSVKVNGVNATQVDGSSTQYRAIVERGKALTSITVNNNDVVTVLTDLYDEEMARIQVPSRVTSVEVNGKPATKVDGKNEYRIMLDDGETINSIKIN